MTTVSVIGLDLSLNGPGLCRTQARAESLRLDAKDGDMRLCQIRDWLAYHVHGYGHALAVIESVPAYATGSAILERVHGVAREVLARYGVPFACVSPTTLKAYATGNSGAEKQAMIDAAAAQAHDGLWAPADDNQADAWHLRQMGRLAFQPEAWPMMPAHQLRAMSVISWPLGAGSAGRVPRPFGELRRRPVVKKCRDGIIAMRNGDEWLHPFTMTVCTKPPK